MWPVRPLPQPGESLSSWLVRLARTNGLETAELCRILWGRRVRLAARNPHDLDRVKSRAALRPLVEATGLPLEQLWALTLNAREERLGAETMRRWLLSERDPHYARPRYDRQACLRCLATHPYHRLEWRFACMAVCPRHRILLIDRCATCRARLAPVLAPFDQDAFCRCFKCGKILRGHRQATVERRTAALQRRVRSALESDIVRLRAGTEIPAQELLASLHAAFTAAAHTTIQQRTDKARAVAESGRVWARFAGHLLPLTNIAPVGRHHLLRLAADTLELTRQTDRRR